MYDSLGECAGERNLSIQGLELLKFKECRRTGIAMEALLQRGPGGPELLDEAGERLVSRGTGMGMEPEQVERERTVDLVKAVETAAANGLLAGREVRLCEILDWHRNAFWRGLRGGRLPVSSH